MPAVVLTPVSITRAGLDHAAQFVAAAAGGNAWASTGAEWAEVANASGGSITVSLVIQQIVDTVTPAPRTVVIPNNKTYKIGPFPQAYNDTSAQANLTYSAVSSVTVAVFKLGS